MRWHHHLINSAHQLTGSLSGIPEVIIVGRTTIIVHIIPGAFHAQMLFARKDICWNRVLSAPYLDGLLVTYSTSRAMMTTHYLNVKSALHSRSRLD